MSHQRAARELVVQIQINASIFQEVRKKAGNRFRIHLAGMERNCGRKVHRADDQDVMLCNLPPRFGQGTIPALFGRQIDDD